MVVGGVGVLDRWCLGEVMGEEMLGRLPSELMVDKMRCSHLVYTNGIVRRLAGLFALIRGPTNALLSMGSWRRRWEKDIKSLAPFQPITSHFITIVSFCFPPPPPP
jgi:hypothetical protein